MIINCEVFQISPQKYQSSYSGIKGLLEKVSLQATFEWVNRKEACQVILEDCSIEQVQPNWAHGNPIVVCLWHAEETFAVESRDPSLGAERGFMISLTISVSAS